MAKKLLRCQVDGCENMLYWQGTKVFKDSAENSRKFLICGDHLPIDGLPEDWPGRDKNTPISNEYRTWED